MCGIIGFVGEPRTRFAEAIDLLTHRGPDARGEFHTEIHGRHHYLGHRRLAIIDLAAAANQPFHKDGLVIVFNGEVYNYRELRSELVAIGTQFLTNSDTEVVLEAWRRWGESSLRRLRGMFAFALLDRRSGETVLARDHFGIKPLYYHFDEAGNLAFASEIKGLSALLDRELEPDDDAIIASLLYLWLPESRSAYRGVHKLAPGHLLRHDGRSCTLRQYWHVRELLSSPRIPDIEELRSVLEESVRYHMVADVPIATMLSGGLDSSLISVLAARHGGQLDAYTIAFREADKRFEAMPDDLVYARKVAKAHGIRLHEIELTPNIIELLPRMIQTLDEPIGDAAAVNVFLMCQAARTAGAKVLLSGIGADELFGGYRRHLANVIAARYRHMPGVARRVIEGVLARLPVASKTRGFKAIRWAKRFQSFATLPEQAAYRRSYTYYGRDELLALIGETHAPVVDRLLDEHAALYADGPIDDHVNRMCYVDAQMFLPSLNLLYTDRASMAASTEIRVPFVDVSVARAAFALPGQRKIARNHTKLALKQAAAAWLPADIIYRPKASFGVPLRAWVRRDLNEMICDLLPNGKLVQRGLANRGVIEKLIGDDKAGRSDNAQRIWHLLTLEIWLQQQPSNAKPAPRGT